ncbi:MAG: hypothetical protein Q9172_001689, partial [Xanthocarpia lactea]
PAELPGVARFAITKPATPGIDFAGTLVQPAAGSILKPGQLVFGSTGTSVLAGGALREFSISKPESTCAIPDGVDPVDAATVGVAGVTAYQSIVPHVKSGDKVFINGGSGGTGTFGIQFAKAVGCHVTTTCSSANVEFCRTLGADRVIDYKQETVLDVLLKAEEPKFDHAVDNVGADEQLPLHCHKFLRPGALFIMVGGEPSLKNLTQALKLAFLPGFLGGVKRNMQWFWPEQKVQDLQQIAEWMQAGKVKAVIDSRFPFEQAVEAFGKLKTGRARGKIVINEAVTADPKIHVNGIDRYILDSRRYPYLSDDAPNSDSDRYLSRLNATLKDILTEV